MWCKLDETLVSEYEKEITFIGDISLIKWKIISPKQIIATYYKILLKFSIYYSNCLALFSFTKHLSRFQKMA